MKTIEGHLDASGLRIALVLGRFNATLGERLLDGAVDCLVRHGAAREDLTVVRVPGAFEIAQAARWLADSAEHDAVVGLGVILRGATIHFDLLSAEVTRALGNVAADTDVPVSFGIVTADGLEQAMERCGTKAGNKGWDAALAAVEMADLRRRLGTEDE